MTFFLVGGDDFVPPPPSQIGLRWISIDTSFDSKIRGKNFKMYSFYRDLSANQYTMEP